MEIKEMDEGDKERQGESCRMSRKRSGRQSGWECAERKLSVPR